MAKTMRELYPEQSQREKVQILDVAAGTGLAGVEVGKKPGSFASSLFSFFLFKIFGVGVGGGVGGGGLW